MPGLCVRNDHGWLEINGHSLATPAVWCYNLWDLILGPDFKGQNGAKPAAPGVFENPMRATETTYDLPIAIAGEVDVTGAVYGVGSTRGFERNLWWIRNNILGPHDDTDHATWDSIFHTSDGLSCVGPVQVLKLVRGQMVDAADLLTGSTGLAMNGVLRVRYTRGAPVPAST